MFAKAILRTPVCHHRQRHVISSILLDHLHTCSLSDGVKILWSSMWDDLKNAKPSWITACNEFNKSRTLYWARKGRYNNSLQALTSTGVAGHDDDSAYQDLLKRHPTSPCPDSNDFPSAPSVTVDDSMVLSCLKGFPKGTSPGASKLHAQHWLDAVSGSTAPAAGECLCSLTCFMNHLLFGKGPTCSSLCLCVAP